jgi:hypothetical protein
MCLLNCKLIFIIAYKVTDIFAFWIGKEIQFRTHPYSFVYHFMMCLYNAILFTPRSYCVQLFSDVLCSLVFDNEMIAEILNCFKYFWVDLLFAWCICNFSKNSRMFAFLSGYFFFKQQLYFINKTSKRPTAYQIGNNFVVFVRLDCNAPRVQERLVLKVIKKNLFITPNYSRNCWKIEKGEENLFFFHLVISE